MADQTSRTNDDRRTGRVHRPPSTSDLAQLADEARSPGTRYAAPLMFLTGALIAIAMAVLVAQNRESTTVEWFTWDPTGPVWVVLAVSFAAGLVTAPLLLGAISLARHRRHDRDERIDVLAHRSWR